MAEFTAEQISAIKTENCALLVSAAAGSGKTSVLVERIIRIVTDMKNPVDIDSLLVVTFTDAAAAEMRRRVLDAINEKLKVEPNNAHLKKQEFLMNRASIMTVHSFCLNVIRKYYYLIDIDPHFKIIDGVESDLIKAEVMRELFEQLYDSDNAELLSAVFGTNDNAEFLRLVECFGDKVKDDGLQTLAISVYDFIQSCPWPENWLKESLDALYVENISQIEVSQWYACFLEDTEMTLKGALSAISALRKLCNHHEINPKALDTLLDDEYKIINSLSALKNGFTEFYHAMDFKFSTLRVSVRRKKGDGEESEELKRLKELISDIWTKDVKKPVTDIKKKALFMNPDGILRNILESHGNIKTLCQIVLEFSKRFYSVKHYRNIADFNDFEHLCIKALLDPRSAPDNIIPSVAALELQKKFVEVMTDEYQDTNTVQELILSIVSKKDNRFMVGDMKQSIYRFRMANPELFAQKYDSYQTDAAGSERRLDLSKNFRSRKNVLDAINFIFGQIMSKRLGELNYDEKAMLYYSGIYPKQDAIDDAERITELLIMETSDEAGDSDGTDDFDASADSAENEYSEDSSEESNTNEYVDNYGENCTDDENLINELSVSELEAAMVASRIKELLGMGGVKPFFVTERNGDSRIIEQRDIVVLLRSTKNIAESYVRQFEKAGLNAFSDTSTGYFESIEIMTALSLLKIVDNPRQDIHLIAVLYSMIYNISPDELIAVRKSLDKGVFYDCVKAYISNNHLNENDILVKKLKKFMDDLDKWRDMAVYTPISDLIQTIYDDTSYFDFAGAMPGGPIRQANLNALFERALNYEKTKRKSLFNFIMYIEKMRKNKSEFGDAKVMNENDNLIRIMSIHKSKGLEFPVVFVCGLGRSFNLRDSRERLLLHRKLGICSVNITSVNAAAGDAAMIKYNTLPRYAIAKKIILESLSEEMRVLYVALTRAKEKLILSGTCKDFEQKTLSILKFSEAITNPYHLSKRKCFLDWIICALLKHRNVLNTLNQMGIESEDGEFAVDDCSEWKISVRDKSGIQKIFEAGYKLSDKNSLSSIDTDSKTDYSGLKSEITRKFSYRYPNIAATKVPSKISITEIKRLQYGKQIREDESLDFYFSMSLAMSLSQGTTPTLGEDLRNPEFINKETDKYNAAQRGTLLHTVMEHLDVRNHRTPAKIGQFIEDLTQKGIFTPDEAASINVWKIVDFVNTELAERMRKSPKIMKETPFVLGMKPSEINFPDCDRGRVLVHGIIDCIFEENDGFVLLDYKSDFVTPETVESVLKKYEIQMNIYKKAVEAVTRQQLKQSLIYFFQLNKWYDI